MARVYPADKSGKCLRGFCPTICDSAEAENVAFELASNMIKYGFKFDNIIIEND